MTTFQSSDEAADILGRFLAECMDDPELGPKFAGAKVKIMMQYTNPDLRLFLDCTQNPPLAFVNDDIPEVDADFSLNMSTDDGHKFWLGNLNVVTSMATRKIKVQGPVTKMMGLLPAIEPTYARYQKFLTDLGRSDLL